MSVKRLDGCLEIFSWVHCCNMTIKSTSALLVEAMREAIKQEIITYKQNSALICNICNSTNEIYEDYHVDHSSPPLNN